MERNGIHKTREAAANRVFLKQITFMYLYES